MRHLAGTGRRQETGDMRHWQEAGGRSQETVKLRQNAGGRRKQETGDRGVIAKETGEGDRSHMAGCRR